MGGLTPPPSSLGGCWCVFLFTSFAISISNFQLSTRMRQPGMSRILVGASMLIGDFYHPQEYVGLASSKTLKSQSGRQGYLLYSQLKAHASTSRTQWRGVFRGRKFRLIRTGRLWAIFMRSRLLGLLYLIAAVRHSLTILADSLSCCRPRL